MKLQTSIPLTPQKNQIDYNAKILLLGSCFVENIGQKLAYYKFENLQNPFGILFSPSAIGNIISRTIIDEPFTEDDIFYYNEQWHCFEVHSSLSSPDKETVLNNLNKKRIQLYEYLKVATHIVFTYGTSWVYKHIKTDVLVANCHKVPQNHFKKVLLSADEVEISIHNINNLIKSINPKVTIVNTVSPVRHIKDGFVENTRSKAHLITAIHKTIDSQSQYFPSYEIMMDELRDYRFYKEDMLHPNNTAISIIWEAFNKVWISSETKHLQKKIKTIQASLRHKPLNVESKEHQLFLKHLNAEIKMLQKKITHIKF